MIENLIEISQTHMFLAVLLFILLRALAVIVPPFLGIAIDIAGIAVFGWFIAFFYAEIGIMAGASIAFGIARFSRNRLGSRVRTPKKFVLWTERLTSRDSLYSWIVIRLVTNPAFDIINYAAGFTKIKFSSFAIATLLGNIPSMLLFYYFAGKGVELGDLKLTIISASIVLVLVYSIYIWIIYRKR